tara:strand:+ start:660 stop:788 length:129 start_codon:yes stop_codon:yes gene_type:complete
MTEIQKVYAGSLIGGSGFWARCLWGDRTAKMRLENIEMRTGE